MENSRLLAEVLAAYRQAEVGSLPLSAAHGGAGPRVSCARRSSLARELTPPPPAWARPDPGPGGVEAWRVPCVWGQTRRTASGGRKEGPLDDSAFPFRHLGDGDGVNRSQGYGASLDMIKWCSPHLYGPTLPYKVRCACIDRLYYQCTKNTLNFPSGPDGKESACNVGQRPGFEPWVRESPWRREWQLTPMFLPGESLGQRNLAGHSPRGSQRVGCDWWLTLLAVLICAQTLCRVWLFVTLCTIARQAPLWDSPGKNPCSPPGDLPDPGIEPCLLFLLHWQAGSLPTGKP